MSYSLYKARIESHGVHEQLGPPGQGWGIEQNPHELATFVVAMQALGVQSVLEIGTGYRAGLARFMANDLQWQVVSVDIRDYGHSFAGVEFLRPEHVPSGSFVTKNGKFITVFDLVFIDGDHAYEAVAADHRAYGTYPAKAVAFHDIAGLRACEGVAQYWREIAYTKAGKLRKGFHEIIDETPQKAGIGWYEVS